MKHLYYVRHGQSQSNFERIFAGREEYPLTKLGAEQAAAAGQKLQALHIDYITTSPSVRAYDTAMIIAEAIGYPVANIERNPLLMERDLTALRGKSWDDIGELIDMPGVEPFEAMLERARQAYAQLQKLPYDTIVVVSHGSFWRALRGVIDPKSLELNDTEPANAEIQKLL